MSFVSSTYSSSESSSSSTCRATCSAEAADFSCSARMLPSCASSSSLDCSAAVAQSASSEYRSDTLYLSIHCGQGRWRVAYCGTPKTCAVSQENPASSPYMKAITITTNTSTTPVNLNSSLRVGVTTLRSSPMT